MEDKILIFTSEREKATDKLNKEKVRGNSAKESYISKRDLTKEISEFSKILNSAIEHLQETSDKFHLSEVVVNAEIPTGGKIGILGFGANAGLKSGLSFKFTRKQFT